MSDGKNNTYSISEVAAKYGISTHTLRYYDKEGLLFSVKRTDSNVRVFTDEDLEWLDILSCLKATGMPIKEIRQFLEWAREGDSTIEQRLHAIQKHTDAVQQQMNELMQHMVTLQYKNWYYQTSLAAGTTSIHGADSRAVFESLIHQKL